MMLTALADVARKAGLHVIEVAGWQSRGAVDDRGAVQGMTDVRTVVCHHTAGPASGNYPSLRIVRDGRSDLTGPLAQLGLARDGTVYVIAAGLANHAGISRDPSYTNSHSIGIEAENTGREPWPGVQIDAYVRLCRALADHYRVPYSRVLGHKETCYPVGRKIDPALDMDMLRTRIAAKPKPTLAPTVDDDLEDSMAPVTFTDANEMTKLIAQGVPRDKAREQATVTYPNSTAALAGALNFLSSALRDLGALKADVAALKGNKA